MPHVEAMHGESRRTFPPPPTAACALVLSAHPNPASFNSALAQSYAEGLNGVGVEVSRVDTDALDFDLRLRGPDFGSQPIEPDIERLMAQVARSAHVVVASPVWWGSVPASLKGLIDRTFLPGWAYRSGESAFPERGLVGRTSRVLLTMDAPGWWDRFKYGRSASRQLENAWLQFVGMKSMGVARFTSIEKTDAAARSRMLRKAHALGRGDGRRVVARGLSFRRQLPATVRPAASR